MTYLPRRRRRGLERVARKAVRKTARKETRRWLKLPTIEERARELAALQIAADAIAKVNADRSQLLQAVVDSHLAAGDAAGEGYELRRLAADVCRELDGDDHRAAELVREYGFEVG